MALLRIDHKPETLKLNVPLYLIVPDPGKIGDWPLADRPVLYLLHGLSEDGSAWSRHTEIETLADDLGLIVVMPSCGRSFYRDLSSGIQTFTYLTEELPAYLSALFGIRPAREKTWISGSSMGGYGSFQAAFARPDLYGAAASFSGVLSLAIIQSFPQDPRQIEFQQMFGDLSRLPGGRMDPLFWLNQAARDPAQMQNLPRLMVSCGRQDDLYPLSIQFREACRAAGLPLVYHEEDGGHHWPFWNRQISRFLTFAQETVGGKHA